MKRPKRKKKVTTVREHPLRVPASSKRPARLTTRHQHPRRLSGTYLGRKEIAATFKSYDRKKLALPTAGKIKVLKNPDPYDDLIAVWADYFNKKLRVDPPQRFERSEYCNSDRGSLAFAKESYREVETGSSADR